MIKIFKHKSLILLSCVLVGLGSCKDDKFLTDIGFDEGGGAKDVINLTMTLDIMGGTRADDSHPIAHKLVEIENYVDPDKTRVLLFDENDKFLFESKSRWVKQLDPATNHSVWSVSVPLYTYGNDKESEYNWNWQAIREKMTTGNFKIAILANRPNYQYYPDVDNGVFGKYWYDNSGPKWTYKNSVCYTGSDGDVKDVFDLHHTQFDPIYWNKSHDTYGGGTAYDFIMGGNWAVEEALLSSTSTWVDFDNDDTKKDPYGWNIRYNKLPSEEDPIPMYGIQQFEPLVGWDEGTTIELNRPNDNPISLLRSVVKTELLLPEGFADDVVIFYANWMARCEPLDVWTPTDQIWKDDHQDSHPLDSYDPNSCEWKLIWNRGPICTNTRAAGIDEYKKVIMWQYGLWKLKKGWYFDPANRQAGTTPSETRGLDNVFRTEYGSLTEQDFPHIFNTCIQRFNRVLINKTYTEDGFDHYVVYLGERNINDPSRLTELNNSGAGNTPVMYWTVIQGNITTIDPNNAVDRTIIDFQKSQGVTVTKKYTSGTTYSFAMVDYNSGYANHHNCTRKGELRLFKVNNKDGQEAYQVMGPDNGAYNGNSNTVQGTGMGEYARRVAGWNQIDGSRPEDSNNRFPYTGDDVPVPLLRNHIYTIKVTNNNNIGTRGGDHEFEIISEVRATEDINFKK